MSIVCATDFSEPAADAALVAAVLASRMHEPLSLVHVVDTRGTGDDLGAALRERAAGRLREAAARLRVPGVHVEETLLGGAPDESILEHAQEVGARLVVTGALGYRSPTRWRLGGVAERLGQRASCPVLVVRGSGAFRAWDRGERPLRVMVAVDFSPTSDAAVRWAGALRELGPCDMLAVHVYRPAEERRRLGLGTPLDSGNGDPEVERLLAHELRARIAGGLGEVAVHLEADASPPADRLVELAARERVDLVVVGMHQRGALGRLWHGSVSHEVVEGASMAVVCVPAAAAGPQAVAALPTVHRVLVPTDLSPLGNRAVPHAYGLVQPGGVVHVLHVIEPHILPNPLYAHYTPGRAPTPEERAQQRAEIVARLRALVPPEAAARRITTALEVVAADEVATAIGDTADRLGVDVICLSSHGRSGVSRAIAGSVAQRVMTESRRPLLVIRPPAT